MMMVPRVMKHPKHFAQRNSLTVYVSTTRGKGAGGVYVQRSAEAAPGRYACSSISSDRCCDVGTSSRWPRCNMARCRLRLLLHEHVVEPRGGRRLSVVAELLHLGFRDHAPCRATVSKSSCSARSSVERQFLAASAAATVERNCDVADRRRCRRSAGGQHLASLVVGDDDLDARDCRVTDCDVRLPSQELVRFRRDVDWSAKDAKAEGGSAVQGDAAGPCRTSWPAAQAASPSIM